MTASTRRPPRWLRQHDRTVLGLYDLAFGLVGTDEAIHWYAFVAAVHGDHRKWNHDRSATRSWERVKTFVRQLGFDIHQVWKCDGSKSFKAYYRLDWSRVAELLNTLLDLLGSKVCPQFYFEHGQGMAELRELLWGAPHREGKFIEAAPSEGRVEIRCPIYRVHFPRFSV
jgi:hypothetical protein